MNWLIKRLANEAHYFPIFLAVLIAYALLGCLVVHWVIGAHPGVTKIIIFLFMMGATAVAYAGRVAHNLAYAKVNKEHND